LKNLFNTLQARSNQTEIMDEDPGPHTYTLEEYYGCLQQLDTIGRWLGGDQATLSAMSKMAKIPKSILDVGCGGGLFTLRLGKIYPEAEILGIDLNPYAIQFAKSHTPFESKVRFEQREKKELNEPDKSFDVVVSTLVCHHIPDNELVSFITKASHIARKKVILNDIHRHPLTLLTFKIISPIFFRNRLVLHDGPISIERAFSYNDWVRYLERAGINKSRYRISWHWAFRWIIDINCEDVND
jgi:2-polyprenyl-3-methyl-5-hydroxy-6-metoxy-1,4-benzoquinol methylase